MEICILAETVKLDEKSYVTIIDRILSEEFGVKKHTFRSLENVRFSGKSDLIKQLPITLTHLIDKYPKLDCIIIIVDSDGKYPGEHNSEKKKIKRRIKRFNESFSGQIVICLPTRNIESWVLCDIYNLKQISGFTTLNTYPLTETIIKPKEEVRRIYSEYRKKLQSGEKALTYSEFIVKIFTSINIKLLNKSSKVFKILLKDLKNWLKLNLIAKEMKYHLKSRKRFS